MSDTSPGNSSVRPPYAAAPMIRGFFERMKNMGEPSGPIDGDWLTSFQLGGSQPHAVVGMLKWLTIIDHSGKSTGKWTDLRTSQNTTLERLVRESYAPVFEAVDVENVDRTGIEGAFIHAYKSGDTGKPVTAFLTLCSLAGIESPAIRVKESGAKRVAATRKAPAAKKTASAGRAATANQRGSRATDGASPKPITVVGAATVTFNVEIPADWDADRVRERVADVLSAVRSFDEP